LPFPDDARFECALRVPGAPRSAPGPISVSTVAERVSLRELPPLRAMGSCLS
jgi:hypothetical protein